MSPFSCSAWLRFEVVPMLLVVGVLKCKGTDTYSEPLQKSTLWQAMIARRTECVCNQMDLMLLLKALCYHLVRPQMRGSGCKGTWYDLKYFIIKL